MTIQDQFTTTVRQTQETWAGAIESYTKGLQKNFGQPFTRVGFFDPSTAIDQVFDFWEKTLEVQRDFAKKLASVTLSASETIAAQVESVKEAVHEQAAQVYAGLTKAELQDELVNRDLPKTGNVDELRDRLVEDDQK